MVGPIKRAQGAIGFCLMVLLMIVAGCASEPAESVEEVQTSSTVVEPVRKLFIIGGGQRPDSLMRAMLDLADIDDESLIWILPWSSSEPDSAFWYAHRQLAELTHARIDSLAKGGWQSGLWNADSLKKADLIYVTGGDQNRFLTSIEGSNVQQWMKEALSEGVTYAGTSAGAALMSEVMITGDQRLQEEYSRTYPTLHHDNGIYSEGLGFVNEAIVDQHFVARSRYNRIFSAMVDHPGKWGLGIDESTALWIDGNNAMVRGAAQVMVFHPLNEITTNDDLIGFRGLRMDALLAGDNLNLVIDPQ